MSQSRDQVLTTGSVLDSYEIAGVIGVGGFGVTYQADDRSLQRTVAIKEYFPAGLALRAEDGCTLNPRTEDDKSDFAYGLTRFLDEARTLARFNDPNIVHVIRFIEANGTAYLVMTYEEGEPLEDWLQRVDSLDEDAVVDIMLPILRGLRSVHAKQFLHRDVKPANIFLRKEGTPILLDFGSARLALEQQMHAMTAVLTPGFAPVEQYSEEEQGPWTDLYAVGATMYRCVRGRLPPESTRRLTAIHNGGADPILKYLKSVRETYSNPFVDKIEWLLQLRASDRPQSADEVLRAFGAGATARSTRPPLRPTTDPDALSVMMNAGIRKSGRSGDTIKLEVAEAAASPPPAETAPPRVPPVTAADIARAESVLPEYLGPIARILIKNVSESANSRAQFVELLANEVDDAEDRKEFLAKMK